LKSSIPDYENTSLRTHSHTPEDLNPQHKTSLTFIETAQYFTELIAHLYKHKQQSPEAHFATHTATSHQILSKSGWT
jgi:hypothetical protein